MEGAESDEGGEIALLRVVSKWSTMCAVRRRICHGARPPPICKVPPVSVSKLIGGARRSVDVDLKHFECALYAFLGGFAFIPEGVAQRSAKLRHHDVQALDGRTFRLMGL